MKTIITRAAAAVLAVCMLLTVVGCGSQTETTVQTAPIDFNAIATQPITQPVTHSTAPADPTVIPVTALMLMSVENIAEFSDYISEPLGEGHVMYTVQNTLDTRRFKLDVRYDVASGAISEATLSYGDTAASLINNVTGGISDIISTEPITTDMTMDNLLTLNPSSLAELDRYTYTATDASHRVYTVTNTESGKTCTLTIALDETGAVSEATLSYGDASADMLQSAMTAILDIMTAMEG